MPIEHTRPQPVPESAPVPEPDVPAGPTELIWVRDIDFVYGKDDAEMLTLAPEDTLTVYDDVFVIELVRARETIEISRAPGIGPRMWSVRYREMVRELRSFDPADAPPAE